MTTNPEQVRDEDTVLAALREAGERRAKANRHELDGLLQLKQAYDDIRRLVDEIDKREDLHLTRPVIAAAVGVTQQGLYNILTHRTKV